MIPVDTAGNEATPSCSSKITVDTVAPNAATSLSWNEGATHDSHTLNASWSVSSSGDVASQILRVHNNASCSSQEGGDYTFSDNTTNTDTVTVSSDGSYYFQVTVEDHAGNTTNSACSSAVSAYLRTTTNTVFQPLPAFTKEGIPMSWDSRANATGYIIYRQEVGNGDIAWTLLTGRHTQQHLT